MAAWSIPSATPRGENLHVPRPEGLATLAEQLGDLKFSALIRDVFRDLTAPLLDHDAEVSHYIGDEIVVTWPLRRGLLDGQCILCYFAVRDEMKRLSRRYVEEYGIEPSFKAGMHCGSVIATEVGQIKSEIVFHGDVLNTASRIQSLCGPEQADLLISEQLADAVPAMGNIQFEHLGARELRGKERPVNVVRVSR